jgi:hypothetical protein
MHNGIVGNELADKIAKEAVTISPNAATARKILIGTDPYSSMFWLATSNHHDADNYPRQQPLQHRYVHNFNKDLATRTYNMQGLAGTKESVDGNLMKQELLTADKNISCAMWDLAANGALTYAHITNAMRARWGGIYTAETAARMNRPYMGTHRTSIQWTECPLCKGADSATHILGECPAHKALHYTTSRCYRQVHLETCEKEPMMGLTSCLQMLEVWKK